MSYWGRYIKSKTTHSEPANVQGIRFMQSSLQNPPQNLQFNDPNEHTRSQSPIRRYKKQQQTSNRSVSTLSKPESLHSYYTNNNQFIEDQRKKIQDQIDREEQQQQEIWRKLQLKRQQLSKCYEQSCEWNKKINNTKGQIQFNQWNIGYFQKQLQRLKTVQQSQSVKQKKTELNNKIIRLQSEIPIYEKQHQQLSQKVKLVEEDQQKIYSQINTLEKKNDTLRNHLQQLRKQERRWLKFQFPSAFENILH